GGNLHRVHAGTGAPAQDFRPGPVPWLHLRRARLEEVAGDVPAIDQPRKGLPVAGRATVELQQVAIPVADLDVVFGALVESAVVEGGIDLHLPDMDPRTGGRLVDAQSGTVPVVNQQVEGAGRDAPVEIPGIPSGDMPGERHDGWLEG